MLCVWCDQRGVVYYELLKSGEMINAKRYQQQLTDLNRFLLEKSQKEAELKEATQSNFSS